MTFLIVNANKIERNFCFKFCSVLKNISESIVALVTKKGESFVIQFCFWFLVVANQKKLSTRTHTPQQSLKPATHCYKEEFFINVQLIVLVGAHHLDLRSAIKEDPEWLTMQRRQEVEIIRKWIDQYHSDISSNANSEI